ncbi:hypothetical protein SUGI_1075950 [Cryptomeria japonica]|nr:hypothetical protein SUGI_1075950 [Cryptomeria japonica]
MTFLWNYKQGMNTFEILFSFQCSVPQRSRVEGASTVQWSGACFNGLEQSVPQRYSGAERASTIVPYSGFWFCLSFIVMFLACLLLSCSGMAMPPFFLLLLSEERNSEENYTVADWSFGEENTEIALAFASSSTILVLSGVAVGPGWQSFVAYISIGSYYVMLGWVFNQGSLEKNNKKQSKSSWNARDKPGANPNPNKPERDLDYKNCMGSFYVNTTWKRLAGNSSC